MMVTPTFFLFGRLDKRSVIAPSGFRHKRRSELARVRRVDGFRDCDMIQGDSRPAEKKMRTGSRRLLLFLLGATPPSRGGETVAVMLATMNRVAPVVGVTPFACATPCIELRLLDAGNATTTA
ncbi:hypothetical protein [Bifidobacterium fermentum]|uniref:hypothetical protein n=1 Tax=Bifidobacterium fermentum TaxID=3059035 RepID=UPI0034E23F12